jgi:hypothetical protein
MWRVAVIPGERLRHGVDERGDHHIELVLRSEEVTYTQDRLAQPLLRFGRSAWASVAR